MNNFLKKTVISTASAGLLAWAGLIHAQTMTQPPAQGPSDTPRASQQDGSADRPAAGAQHGHGSGQASPSGGQDRSGQAGGADRTHPHADGAQEAGKLQKSKDGAGSAGENRKDPAATDRGATDRGATDRGTTDRGTTDRGATDGNADRSTDRNTGKKSEGPGGPAY